MFAEADVVILGDVGMFSLEEDLVMLAVATPLMSVEPGTAVIGAEASCSWFPLLLCGSSTREAGAAEVVGGMVCACFFGRDSEAR